MRNEPGEIPDVPVNLTASWIAANTPPDAVFLNSFWFYHPANLAGRKIFSGYPYFTWSYGYDKEKREVIAREIYGASTVQKVCELSRIHHISYIELTPKPEYVEPNRNLWNYLPAAYANDTIQIYDVNMLCR